MRAIIHADDRHLTNVIPGPGRFLICEQDDVLAITLHLPFVNNEDEQEIIRNLTLAEISATIRRRRKWRQVLVQGDFNIDWLPAHQCDPLQSPERQSRHAAERMQLLAWAESCGLTLVLPDACISPHPSHEETMSAPISKLNSVGPPFALLDYCFATPGLVSASWLMWWPEQSDHAVLVNCLKVRPSACMRKGKTKWKPTRSNDTEQCIRLCPF